jgi:hypothetical protein
MKFQMAKIAKEAGVKENSTEVSTILETKMTTRIKNLEILHLLLVVIRVFVVETLVILPRIVDLVHIHGQICNVLYGMKIL